MHQNMHLNLGVPMQSEPVESDEKGAPLGARFPGERS